MTRDLKQLTDFTFDLLIIGGGINGAVLSWMASLAGLSVALIEKGDFAQATSANSQKIIHGGLRYLQNLDFPRVRQSLKERTQLMWLSPHLVHPLPCIMPLYGHGMKGKEAMWLGLQLFDLIGRSRNDTPDPSKFIPSGKILSVAETNHLIPDVSQKGLKGGAQWYDAICYNTERLVVSFIKSAHKRGAVVANYVGTTTLNQHKDSLIVVTSQDQLSGQSFDILAKKVVNITGPWINDLIDSSKPKLTRPKLSFACGINIITPRIFSHATAVAVRNPSDSRLRLYFVVPWRGKSIIGTEWFIYTDHPDNFKVREQQCFQLISNFNLAYPPAKLTVRDIQYVHGGLVPCAQTNGTPDNEINILKHFHIIDHSADGIKGMVSVAGVKYTTGGDLSEKVLTHMFPSINITPPLSRPQLEGAHIDNFSSFQTTMVKKLKSQIDEKEAIRLTLDYGTEIDEIIKLAIDEDPTHSTHTGNALDILKGETLFALREEMAQKLSDIIIRRTNRGTAGHILDSDLIKMSSIMAHYLGWSEARRRSEIEEVNNYYPSFIQSKTC